MTKAPRYQPFYDLDGPKFDQLKADIALRGVVIPILVDEAGATIDGHQRRRACAELGVECPRTIVKGATEEDKLGLAIALNAHRRHLSGVERSKAVTQLRTMGWSIRSIAETLQVGAGTVHRDLAGVPSGTPDRVTGKDGKSYEAEQPPRPPADENGEPNGSTDVDAEDVEGEDPHPADEATTSPSHSQGGDDATPARPVPSSPPAPPETPAEREARVAEEQRVERNRALGDHLIGLNAVIGDANGKADQLLEGWDPDTCPAYLVDATRFLFTGDGMRDLAARIEKFAAKWEAAGV